MNKPIDHIVMDNSLILEKSGARVEFPFPITNVLCFDNVLVLIIEPKPEISFNENVFGVGADGKVLWTIEPRKHVYEDSPYTCILPRNDKVQLFNWDGDELLVDPVTGKIFSTGYGK